MDSVSISQLKTRPAEVISMALDYPVAVASRSKVKAYLIGKNLYEKIVAYIEEHIDAATVKQTDFSKGKDFDEVAKELGI